jgi:OmpA-OmpF porin, OOP family
MLRRKLSVAAILAVAALLSVAAAGAGALRIETASIRAVTDALAQGGHGWARVVVDGLQVRIAGTAPDEAARFAALSTAAEVVAPARIRDATDVVPPQALPPPRFSVEILRTDSGVSLIGLVPGAAAQTRLVAAVGRTVGGAPVADLLDHADAPAPDGWDAAARFAATVLADLPRAKLTATPGRVRITAVAEDEAAKRRLSTRLVRAAPEGVSVALDLRAPRPVVAPYSLRFVLDTDGARFDSCTADTEEAQARIVAAGTAAGVLGKIDCPLGLGAPAAGWGRAAAAAIDAVAGLGGGTVTFADGDIALVAAPGTDETAFAAAARGLEAALPPGFSLTAQRPPDPAAAGAPELTAIRGPEGLVQLRGAVPDAGVVDTVAALAEARFGRPGLRIALTPAEGLPQGWTLRAVAGIEALARLDSGSLRVQPDTLTLRGVTGDPGLRARLTRLLTERLGERAAFTLDIRYDERLDPALNLPTPEACVADIGAVLGDGQITFDPGEPNIAAGAGAVIGQIAAILTDCEAVPMRIEIGGHTDSQGREQMNLDLSQARAEAVIDALMARGAPISGLIARGYGETRPIADNGTEEGREANRRIEFRLLDTGGPDGATDDGATDAPAGADAPATNDTSAGGDAGAAPDAEEAPDGQD